MSAPIDPADVHALLVFARDYHKATAAAGRSYVHQLRGVEMRGDFIRSIEMHEVEASAFHKRIVASEDRLIDATRPPSRGIEREWKVRLVSGDDWPQREFYRVASADDVARFTTVVVDVVCPREPLVGELVRYDAAIHRWVICSEPDRLGG